VIKFWRFFDGSSFRGEVSKSDRFLISLVKRSYTADLVYP